MYDGLSPDRVLFGGNYLSIQKLYLLFDSGHYNVITNLKAVMARNIYVTRVTHYMINRTSVTELAPCVQ